MTNVTLKKAILILLFIFRLSILLCYELHLPAYPCLRWWLHERHRLHKLLNLGRRHFFPTRAIRLLWARIAGMNECNIPAGIVTLGNQYGWCLPHK